MKLRPALVAVALVAAAAACSPLDTPTDASTPATTVTAPTFSTEAGVLPAANPPAAGIGMRRAPDGGPTVLQGALPPLIGPELLRSGDPDVVFRAKADPRRIRLPALGVDAAVVPVGVEPNGELQIPRREQAGWYSFGPRPGEAGASVLAGHVDYDGLPGVFFELASATVGDKVVVQLDDGVERTFELTEVTRYDKDSLPADAVWRRDGDPTLVLITCGGAFDPVRRTYESNTVAFARLVV